MRFFESVCELLEAAVPWSTVEAEAPAKDDKDEDKEEGETAEESKDGDDEKEEAGDGDKEEEDEEEDEEEIVDPREKLVEECENSKGCAPSKHHFDECVERVTGATAGEHNKKHPGEDCVEEFFHLAHCANQCAAPKLWAQLK